MSFGKRGVSSPGTTSRPVPRPPDPPAASGAGPDETTTSGFAILMGLAASAVLGVAIVVASVVAFNSYPWGGVLGAISGASAAADYVSPLDASCGRGWTKDLPNGRQLRCYLTTNVSRLCKPEERRHLVAVLQQYSTDAAAFDRAFAVASLQMIGKVQTQGFKLGYMASKVTHERNSQRQQAEDWKEIDSISEDISAAPNAVLRSAKDHVPQHILVADIKTLMLKGLISVEEFGWAGNSLVESAQRDIDAMHEKVAPICPGAPKAG